MTSIMTEIQSFQPPSLSLPAIERLPSFSAPQSRMPTPPKHMKKRQSFSLPVSPKAKPLSPIAKKALAPIRSSPTRALKKHIYAATFASHNPRARKADAPCPVHSYNSAEAEIKCKPSRSVGGVKFGETPREVMQPVRLNCPMHVYSEAKSTLSQLGGASFAKFEEAEKEDKCPVHAYATPPSSMRLHAASFAKYEERAETTDKCPVHVYATPPSSMRLRPSTFAKAVTPRMADVATSAPAVHAYAEPTSTLTKGGALFSTSRASRDTFQRTDRALAPTHSYGDLKSTLRSTGGATFGSTPRSSFLGAGGLSRTGLIVAARAEADEKPSRWTALKPLPKLMPLKEISVLAEASPAKAAWDEAEENGSPREVEALLEAPQSPA